MIVHSCYIFFNDERIEQQKIFNLRSIAFKTAKLRYIRKNTYIAIANISYFLIQKNRRIEKNIPILIFKIISRNATTRKIHENSQKKIERRRISIFDPSKSLFAVPTNYRKSQKNIIIIARDIFLFLNAKEQKNIKKKKRKRIPISTTSIIQKHYLQYNKL